MNKCQGTIIRRIPLTESSMIVTWCTKDHGLLKTVAKGARRPKSQFFGKLDLFYEAEFEIIRSKKTDLHNLREMKILMTRANIRQSYLKTLSASYFAKMIDKVSESDSPINSLYELLYRGLNYLEENEPKLLAIRHYEREMTKILGISNPDKEPITSISEICKIPKIRSEILKLVQKEPEEKK